MAHYKKDVNVVKVWVKEGRVIPYVDLKTLADECCVVSTDTNSDRVLYTFENQVDAELFIAMVKNSSKIYEA